ncbi:MAG: arylsulfatase [Pirellulaceae bacterium]
MFQFLAMMRAGCRQPRLRDLSHSIAAFAITVYAMLHSQWIGTRSVNAGSTDRPNVVLIMTDDQGIGDFGATGNRVIETPHIDAMAAQSASMNTFYVSPVCSPTRACLMTGRYNYRTRCIDTYLGRSMMDPEEVTVAELLSDAGYATGIFGKWHLGDNYPMRPNDQGFVESLVHRGGGLAQPSEPRENHRRYTDPLLFHNGRQVQTKGYCTDVYFQAAMRFIKRATNANRNFFVYLPTNAPHGPYHDVPEELRKKYMKKDLASLIVGEKSGKALEREIDRLARIAAMITNVDENVGRLLESLDQLGITDNTLVIFLVDNGPNTRRYVGNRRGMKSQVHEGGVRSPLWLHWPARLKAGVSRDELSAHIDLLPTILDACGVPRPQDLHLDGRSLLPLLEGKTADWSDRSIVIQSHRGDRPVRYHHFMIRDSRWKLLHASGFGREQLQGPPQFELYDIANDPGESHNLIDEQPAVFARLKKLYEEWFEDVSSTRPDNYAPPRIHIGTRHENPSVLTRQDWRGGSWAPDAIGHWELHIAVAGHYTIRLDFDAKPDDGIAEVKIGWVSRRMEIAAGATTCEFTGLELPAGDTPLHVVLSHGDRQRGVYQAVVEKQ